jgi:voltage-gated potassium channel
LDANGSNDHHAVHRLTRLRIRLRELYHGQSKRAVRFRYAVILIDFIIIGFFVLAPFMPHASLTFLVADYFIAVILALDLVARALAWRGPHSWFTRPIVWVDFFVLLTLLAPQFFFNLGFLRVMRLWTLVHSDFFWETIGRRYDETRWEEIGKALATLVTFLFVVTGFVYASFAGRHQDINSYLDALYFSVSTLTTTGFGDVTLPGTWGKILSIIMMVTGITLFVRLAQAIMRPGKVRFPCPTCGLLRHDLDAVHCKACGQLLNIPNDE